MAKRKRQPLYSKKSAHRILGAFAARLRIDPAILDALDRPLGVNEGDPSAPSAPRRWAGDHVAVCVACRAVSELLEEAAESAAEEEETAEDHRASRRRAAAAGTRRRPLRPR